MRRRSDIPREFELDVTRLSHEGRGVGNFNGKTVFVADALPGERIQARIVRRHRRYEEAVTARLDLGSPDRVEPPCPHAAQCGGCSLQHLAPEAQLRHKQAVLLELLQHQAKTRPDEVLLPLRGPALGYRRRARLSVRMVPKKGRLLVGFREKATHYVTEITRCLILVPEVGERIEALREVLEGLSIREQIPQIEVAADDHGALLILRTLQPPSADDLDRLRAFEQATGILLYLQAGDLAGAKPLTLGRALEYAVAGVNFEYLPGDFVQVNAGVNQALVPQAVALLEPSPGERVLDLFCGLGNFTLPIARSGAQVLGLEGEAGLVTRAEANARANALPNARFAVADLFSPGGIELAAQGSPDRVLLDPPRSGAEQVLAALDLSATRRVVYVSCNPVTLARDAGILLGRGGFRLRAAGIVDMFPHTAHVESIAVFDRVR
jgi:23S rRNA (uracil1939-C5)-methyltransferase